MATAAASGLPDDFNEDDFEGYNPHPYLGGYNIVLAYGQPLPPSSATCYPISIPASSASPPPPPPPPGPPSPLPTAAPPLFDYALPENNQPEPFPSPDLFRVWPFSSWEDYQAYGVSEAGGGWNGWKRALDYLFGHSEGYGERRVGVDSYGIPIYASKKLAGAESVVVEVEPAPVQRLQYYDNAEDWSSCYSEKADEHGYGNPVIAYNNYYSTEALHVEIDPNKSVSHHKLNYHEASEDKIHHYLALDEQDYVTEFFGSPGIAYNKHHYEQPLHVQFHPTETIWSQKSRYYEVYQESAFPTSNWSSSYDEREGEIDFFGSAGLSDHNCSTEPSDYLELEPFKSSWSQNMVHNENYSSVADQAEKSSILQGQNYHTQRAYYEQAQCVPLEPDNSTWSQYSSYYDEAHSEQTSQIFNSGGDSHFYPFQKILE